MTKKEFDFLTEVLCVDTVWDEETGEVLEIVCTIMGCPSEGTLQKVVKTGVTPGSDPTQYYKLACGSTVI